MRTNSDSSDIDCWMSPPAEPRSQLNEVHVWRVGLARSKSEVESLYKLLSEDERDRAERFRFERHRTRFIVARGAMRKILGLYMRQKPDSLHFDYTYFGKPFLQDVREVEAIRFNLSHARDIALCAVAHKREIGVDVEFVRADVDCESIAAQFFNRSEIETLLSIPEELRTQAFFKCWTSKEAYIKARGEGLSMPLDEFNVSLHPGEPAALLWASDSKEVARWSLRELIIGHNYVAALAVEGCDWRLRCWDYALADE